MLACAALWGWTFVLVKHGISEQSALSFNTWRFGLGALLLSLLTLQRIRRFPLAGWGSGALLGVMLALGYTAQTLGLDRTSVSDAGFVTGSFVVFIPLVAWVFLKRRPTRPTVIAIALVCAGLALLTGFSGDGDAFGNGLVLLCAVLWSMSILYTERAVQRFDWVALVAVQTITCAVLCTLIAALSGPIQTPQGSGQWASIAVVIAIATVAAPLLQAHGQRQVPAERAGLLLATQPVFATAAGYLVFSDRLTVGGWLGCALIMSALVLVSRREPLASVVPEPV